MSAKQVHRGSLDSVPPSRLVADIFRGRFTGILSLAQGERRKSLFIRNGSMIFADSTEMEDRLGQVLVRGGKVTEEQIQQALQMQQENGEGDKRLLGAILVKEGFIQPLDLVWGVQTQVEDIFCDCFRWTEGSFEFVVEENPGSWDVITLDLVMPELLRRAISLAEDPISLANLLGDFGQLIDVNERWMDLVDRFKLEALEFDLLGRAHAGADTVGTLVLSSPYIAAETARGIVLLHCVGALTLIPAP